MTSRYGRQPCIVVSDNVWRTYNKKVEIYDSIQTRLEGGWLASLARRPETSLLLAGKNSGKFWRTCQKGLRDLKKLCNYRRRRNFVSGRDQMTQMKSSRLQVGTNGNFFSRILLTQAVLRLIPTHSSRKLVGVYEIRAQARILACIMKVRVCAYKYSPRIPVSCRITRRNLKLAVDLSFLHESWFRC